MKGVDYTPELQGMEVPFYSRECDSSYKIDDMDRSQLCDSVEKHMDHKEVPMCNEKYDSPDETNGNQSSTYAKKCKGKMRRPKYKHLDLQCGWLDCNYRTSHLSHFVHHVSLHIPHLQVKENENHEGTNNVVFPRFLGTSRT
jgi:hypothetical protein